MSSKVIVLRGYPEVDEQNSASAAIPYGSLIEKSSGSWRVHSTAAGHAAKVFALERDELGKDITDSYASGERVKAGYCKSGDRINAIIASGETVTEGQELESDGAGRLKVGTTSPVARAGAAGSPASAHYRLAVVII